MAAMEVPGVWPPIALARLQFFGGGTDRGRMYGQDVMPDVFRPDTALLRAGCEHEASLYLGDAAKLGQHLW